MKARTENYTCWKHLCPLLLRSSADDDSATAVGLS